MAKVWWTSSSGRIELQIPEEAIAQCTHSGQCDADVEYWVDHVDFSRISTDIMQLELKEYGAWGDLQTVDRNTLQQRLVWIACGELADSNKRDYVEG